MPTDVDGTFVAVGGAGLIPSLKAYEQAHGPIDGKKFIGNLFWGTRVSSRSSARASPAPTSAVPDGRRPATREGPALRQQVIGKWFKTFPPLGAAAPRRRARSPSATTPHLGPDQGPAGGQGQPRRRPEAAAEGAREGRAADAAYGTSARQEPRRRSSPSTSSSSTRRAGKLAVKTVGYIPRVDQTFGGTFSPSHAGAGTEVPDVREAEPAVGRQDADIRRSPAKDDALSEAVHAETPCRSSACGGSAGVSAASTPSATSTSTSRTASAAPSSGRTAPGRRRCSTSSRATPADVGHDRVLRRGRHERAGAPAREARHSRTYQKSRLFLGLTVEDNLYLAVLGVRRATCGRSGSRKDGEFRERARARSGRRARRRRSTSLVGSLSHGEQRQLEVGMARAGNPQLMMLDEPASGLSRGERVR